MEEREAIEELLETLYPDNWEITFEGNYIWKRENIEIIDLNKNELYDTIDIIFTRMSLDSDNRSKFSFCRLDRKATDPRYQHPHFKGAIKMADVFCTGKYVTGLPISDIIYFDSYMKCYNSGSGYTIQSDLTKSNVSTAINEYLYPEFFFNYETDWIDVRTKCDLTLEEFQKFVILDTNYESFTVYFKGVKYDSYLTIPEANLYEKLFHKFLLNKKLNLNDNLKHYAELLAASHVPEQEVSELGMVG